MFENYMYVHTLTPMYVRAIYVNPFPMLAMVQVSDEAVSRRAIMHGNTVEASGIPWELFVVWVYLISPCSKITCMFIHTNNPLPPTQLWRRYMECISIHQETPENTLIWSQQHEGTVETLKIKHWMCLSVLTQCKSSLHSVRCSCTVQGALAQCKRVYGQY